MVICVQWRQMFFISNFRMQILTLSWLQLCRERTEKRKLREMKRKWKEGDFGGHGRSSGIAEPNSEALMIFCFPQKRRADFKSLI